MDKIKQLERQLDRVLIESSKDKVTERNKWKPRNLDRLNKQARKKPEYVLVQYLRNTREMEFKLCKVISGNIIVMDNKGHEIDFRATWRHGKYIWYIIHEGDTKPVVPLKIEKLRAMQRSTEAHPILMKMVLGAVQKKEEIKQAKNVLWWIIGLAVVGVIVFSFIG